MTMQEGELNKYIVAYLLQKYGPLDVTTLSALSGLSDKTVRKILNQLDVEAKRVITTKGSTILYTLKKDPHPPQPILQYITQVRNKLLVDFLTSNQCLPIIIIFLSIITFTKIILFGIVTILDAILFGATLGLLSALITSFYHFWKEIDILTFWYITHRELWNKKKPPTSAKLKRG